MHYRGLLRVARREGGTRVYAPRLGDATPVTMSDAEARLDALLDIIVRKYAPLPAASLGQLLAYLRRGVPQWESLRASALKRARQRLGTARVDGVDWYWPADEDPRSRRWKPDDQVRLLTPFDPVVWDRRRFEMFWGWTYRFEAYTPAPKRKLGYYALPVLWGDRVIGWANLSVVDGELLSTFGYVEGRGPRDVGFRVALEEELSRARAFLGLEG